MFNSLTQGQPVEHSTVRDIVDSCVEVTAVGGHRWYPSDDDDAITFSILQRCRFIPLNSDRIYCVHAEALPNARFSSTKLPPQVKI